MSASLFPRRTTTLILLLCLLVGVLIYTRLTNKVSLQKLQPSPTGQPIPSITPQPTSFSPSPVISIPTPTPILVNPKTGWHIYQNQNPFFSFEYPPKWQQSRFAGTQGPTVLVGTAQGNDLAAISVGQAIPSESDFPPPTASPSAFSYAGWTGTQSTSKQQSLSFTHVSVTYLLPSGNPLYLTFLRSVDKGNSYTIDNYLKPILKSFRFQP